VWQKPKKNRIFIFGFQNPKTKKSKKKPQQKGPKSSVKYLKNSSLAYEYTARYHAGHRATLAVAWHGAVFDLIQRTWCRLGSESSDWCRKFVPVRDEMRWLFHMDTGLVAVWLQLFSYTFQIQLKGKEPVYFDAMLSYLIQKIGPTANVHNKSRTRMPFLTTKV
jgi:hypothetical protein